MKNKILKLLTREPLVDVFRPFQGDATTIFMLHRFADSEYGNPGHSIEALRANLSFLRRHRFRLVGLPELVGELEEGGRGCGPAVAFTVDDGYGDFARVAAPVFAEFDCPVTVFVTTGFVDGGFWMWWDKVIWALIESRRQSVQLVVDRNCYRYSLESRIARWRASSDLIERIKWLPDVLLQSTIDHLLESAEVELPRELPCMFLPMTWSDVSRCAEQGVTFGPHTVTHPILSRVDDSRSATEIEGSWQRLRTTTSAAIPVFCFPNGDYPSFTERERRIVRSIGMRACVLAEQHFTTSAQATLRPAHAIAELPRFAYPDDPAQFRQIVIGLERLKRIGRNLLSSPLRAKSDEIRDPSRLSVHQSR